MNKIKKYLAKEHSVFPCEEDNTLRFLTKRYTIWISRCISVKGIYEILVVSNSKIVLDEKRFTQSGIIDIFNNKLKNMHGSI